jgi:hypothetical protein
MTEGMSMPAGQTPAQRPQPVHTHGKFEATTSSTRPLANMRMTLRVSHPAMPGVPVTGQPLAQDPQTMQAEKSNRSKKERNPGLRKQEEMLTSILARQLNGDRPTKYPAGLFANQHTMFVFENIFHFFSATQSEIRQD